MVHLSKDCRALVKFEPRERNVCYEQMNKMEGPNNEFGKTQVTRKDGKEGADFETLQM
jgi:hypothetical protein